MTIFCFHPSIWPSGPHTSSSDLFPWVSLSAFSPSPLQTPLRTTFLKRCFHLSFFSETHKSNLLHPPVNPNLSAWLPHPRPCSLSARAVGHFACCLLDWRFHLRIYNHVVLDLGCLSFLCSKFCKFQTKPCHAILNPSKPHLQLFCKSADFADRIEMNLPRTPSWFRAVILNLFFFFISWHTENNY